MFKKRTKHLYWGLASVSERVRKLVSLGIVRATEESMGLELGAIDFEL